MERTQKTRNPRPPKTPPVRLKNVSITVPFAQRYLFGRGRRFVVAPAQCHARRIARARRRRSQRPSPPGTALGSFLYDGAQL